MPPRQPVAKRQRSVDVAVIALFLAALAAPWCDALARDAEARGPQREQRLPALRPVLAADIEALTRFPDEYAAWFADSFGLRDHLLRWHSIEKLFLLGVSPTEQVVLGAGGDFFYTGDDSVEIHRGRLPLAPAELEAWRAMLASRRAYFAARGIEYVFMLAPDKESVYPERYPRRFAPVGPSRREQLLEYLGEHSDVEMLDLTGALRRAKADDRPDDELYFALGSHWNGRGALVAYRELLARLGTRIPALQPVPSAALERVSEPGNGDSWGGRLYIDDLLPQAVWEFVPAPAVRARVRVVAETTYGPNRRLVTEVDDPSLPRGIVFHDSFGPILDSLLQQHFARLTMVWSPFIDIALIEAERPDVVIDIAVERALRTWDPARMHAREEDGPRMRFERAREALFALDVARIPAMLRASDSSALTALTGAGGTGDERGIEIAVHERELTLFVERFDPPHTGEVLLHVDISAPAPTVLHLWTRAAGAAEYSRRGHRELLLRTGRNRIHLSLQIPEPVDAWMIRPGELPGRYVLHALEARRLGAP